MLTSWWGLFCCYLYGLLFIAIRRRTQMFRAQPASPIMRGSVLSIVLMLFSVRGRQALNVVLGKVSTGRPSLQPFSHKPIKLPVWPVWSGVVAQVAEWVGLPDIAQEILTNIGGRVVPITLSDLNASPFLLLAHHSHSFTPLDPIRALTTLFLPEGFPAHPHSGFDTVTYCLEGGLRHRDSEGIKMAYGDGDVQWMRAGRGVIHEEMWDLEDSDWKHKRIEIFQLWVNLPQRSKGLPPSVHHLRKSEIPIRTFDDGVSMRVICGSATGSGGASTDNTIGVDDKPTEGPGSYVCQSPVGIYHLTMNKGGSSVEISADSGSVVTIYVRHGSLALPSSPTSDNKNSDEEVGPGDVALYRPTNTGSIDLMYRPAEDERATAHIVAGSKGLDALVLVGKPLNEPVLWSGPLVQAEEDSFAKSARAFNSIGRGGYWDYKMSDSDWEEHCKKLRLQDVISAARGD